MKHRWIGALALEIAESLAAGLLAALAGSAGALLHGLMLWGFMPLAGLAIARGAVRRGLNNYAAWIAPAACLCAANLLVWGYSPPAGAGLLTALTSLVGAAAGEVANQRSRRGSSQSKKTTRS